MRNRQSAKTKGFKTCKTCHETLPIEQFPTHGKYFQPECKKCYNIHMSEYKRAHKESVNETARKYRLKPSFIAKREARKDARLKYVKPTLTNLCVVCLKPNQNRICPQCKNSMIRRIRHERVHMRKTHPCPICSKPIVSMSEHPDCRLKHNRQKRKYHYENTPGYRERILSNVSEYHKANRDKMRERERLYRKEHPEKVRAKEKNREYRERGAEGSYTHTEWEELTNKYQGQCIRCHSKPDHLTVDHVVPISLKGTNYIFNLQPLCVSCNSKKSTKMTDYRTEIWIQGIPVMSLPLMCCLFYVWDKVFWHNEGQV